ncbi:MAG: hypothetical protein IK100_09430 [Muribaculaceae bacterium]|nr:hypothetical protein [Muribaculaceae bacterium]
MGNDDSLLYNAPSGCLSSFVGVSLALLACLLLSLMFAGCKAHKEVQVERVEIPVVVTQEHTIESVKIDHVRDTLIQRDSIYHYVQGDTTIIERWHHVHNNTTIIRVDTLHQVDSVPYPVEVVRTKDVTKIEEVDKPLKWYQKTLMWVGGLSLIGVALFLVWKFRKK